MDELVRITQGPFKGLEGRVVALGQLPPDEITLIVTVMGRETSINLSANHCEALTDSAFTHDRLSTRAAGAGLSETQAAALEAEDCEEAMSSQPT